MRPPAPRDVTLREPHFWPSSRVALAYGTLGFTGGEMASTEARICANVLSALLAAAPVAASAQWSALQGRVLSDSGKPIAGATVTLNSVRYSVRTDTLGRFHLNGTPGSTLILTLQAAGFREQEATVVLSRGRSTQRDFALVSEGTALPETNPSDLVLRVRALTADNEPIAYATLQINGGRRYVSDDSGRLAVPITIRAKASLLMRRIGFEPTEVILTEMPDTAVQVRMRSVARTLETQVVTVRSPYARLDLGGFYRRMKEVERGARTGYFVTPEDLELRRPLNVTDAVEQFPDIQLRQIDDGKMSPDGMYHSDGMPLARKFRIENRNGCPLTVYLDRIRIQPKFVRAQEVDEEVNTLVQPQSVAGIEVYMSKGGAPPEFQAYERTCGVVVIWTK